jgi:hypothetical protein
MAVATGSLFHFVPATWMFALVRTVSGGLIPGCLQTTSTLIKDPEEIAPLSRRAQVTT